MPSLIEDACEAQELFELDELEQYAEQWRKDHPEIVAEIEACVNKHVQEEK